MKIDEAIAVLRSFKEESQKHKDNYTPIGSSNYSSLLKIMQDTYQNNIDAFDMAIEALERTRWIPVSERLPEKDKSVFVFTDCGETDFAYIGHTTGHWFTNGMLLIPTVTHWMPLPSIPSEGKI